jgi:hypothetical protein
MLILAAMSTTCGVDDLSRGFAFGAFNLNKSEEVRFDPSSTNFP